MNTLQRELITTELAPFLFLNSRYYEGLACITANTPFKISLEHQQPPSLLLLVAFVVEGELVILQDVIAGVTALTGTRGSANQK